jgi:hypothetical protein
MRPTSSHPARHREPRYRSAFAYLREALDILTERFVARGWPPGRSVSNPRELARGEAVGELLRALRDGALLAEGDFVRACPGFKPSYKGETRLPTEQPVWRSVPANMWMGGTVCWQVHAVWLESETGLAMYRHVRVLRTEIDSLWRRNPNATALGTGKRGPPPRKREAVANAMQTKILNGEWNVPEFRDKKEEELVAIFKEELGFSKLSRDPVRWAKDHLLKDPDVLELEHAQKTPTHDK